MTSQNTSYFDSLRADLVGAAAVSNRHRAVNVRRRFAGASIATVAAVGVIGGIAGLPGDSGNSALAAAATAVAERPVFGDVTLYRLSSATSVDQKGQGATEFSASTAAVSLANGKVTISESPSVVVADSARNPPSTSQELTSLFRSSEVAAGSANAMPKGVKVRSASVGVPRALRGGGSLPLTRRASESAIARLANSGAGDSVDRAMALAGDTLASPGVPAEAKAGVFDALGRLDGVRVRDNVSDPLGRDGSAATFTSSSSGLLTTYEIVFSKTGRFLALTAQLKEPAPKLGANIGTGSYVQAVVATYQ